MASCFHGGAGWPEPVVRVQAVSDTCGDTIPERYVKPPSERPSLSSPAAASTDSSSGAGGLNNIPVVDMSMLDADETCRAVAAACREWGFFQAVNHGVSPELLRRARASWRGFFKQPAEVRERYANSPATYEGYGSRLGTAKGGPLDWGDYYFLHLLPPSIKSHDKWPSLPPSLRDTTEEYSQEVLQLARRVMRLLSSGLGLDVGRLQDAFGGAGGEGACMRVNFYPRCPQPELTLGVAAHSDPGGMTMLLVDDHVRGLQVRSAVDGQWITVDPVPDAFIVNIGDQIQVFVAWLDMVTYLHHHGHEDKLPWYRGKEWSYLRGGLTTLDRDYGLINNIHHDIGTHVIHHLFPQIPHYHLVEATEAAKPVLGKYYKEPMKSGPLPFHLFGMLAQSLKQDHYVSDTGDVVYYQTDSKTNTSAQN